MDHGPEIESDDGIFLSFLEGLMRWVGSVVDRSNQIMHPLDYFIIDRLVPFERCWGEWPRAHS